MISVAGTLIWVTLVWFFYPISPGNSLISYVSLRASYAAIAKAYTSSFTHVSGSIGGTRLILNVRRTALKPHSGSLADSDEPTSAMELPVVSPRRHRPENSFHVTQGPSFGNLDIDHFDEGVTNMDDDDDDDDGGFISPVDYGHPAARFPPPHPKDSGVHLPHDDVDDRWAAVSGRNNGMGKVLDAQRSRP